MDERRNATDDNTSAEATGVKAIVKAAQEPEAFAFPVMTQTTDDAVAETVNLALMAERKLVAVMVGDNQRAKESIMRQLSSLRDELTGSCPSPLDRILVERVVTCWLQVQYAESLFAQRLNDTSSVKRTEHIQRFLDGAHRRYLSALRALAQVRRLALPNVQVNIAEKQVNLASQS